LFSRAPRIWMVVRIARRSLKKGQTYDQSLGRG
jgi:hypothetical protein